LPINKIFMNRVKNKVAIVTGGALGLGRAAAIRLAEEGARVAVTDISDHHVINTVDEINKAGGEAAFWHLDVSNEAEVAKVNSEIAAKWGRIDVLVNNAETVVIRKPEHKITDQVWDKVMDAKVKGVLFCTKHTVPYMLKAGGGSIINLFSIYGLSGAGDLPPYHASIGALRIVKLMSKSDALKYAKKKIRVNSVHPGFISMAIPDGFVNALVPNEKKARKALLSKHPLGCLGEPDDIAWGIVYLASDESKFITGSELVIDGGYTAK